MANKSRGKGMAWWNTDMKLLLGRVLVAVLFLDSGWRKLADLGLSARNMRAEQMPLSNEWSALFYGALMAAGGLMFLAGWRTRLAAWVMAVYMLPLTWFVYLLPAWNAADAAVRLSAHVHVVKNFAIIGALVLLACAGAGRISLDGKAGRK